MSEYLETSSASEPESVAAAASEPNGRFRLRLKGLGSEDDDGSDDGSDDDSDSDDGSDSDELKRTLCILKESDPEAHDALIPIYEHLKSSLPDLMKIIKSDLLVEDKAKLLEIFEVWLTTADPAEKLQIKTVFNERQKHFQMEQRERSRYSDAQLALMNAEAETLGGLSRDNLKYRILSTVTSKQNKAIMYEKYLEFKELDHSDDEYGKLKQWLYWALKIPTDVPAEMPADEIDVLLARFSAEANRRLFGMQCVKEQVLLFMNTKLRHPSSTGASMAMVGPPGTGKTSVARLFASLANWPFQQLSLNGVTCTTSLKGSDFAFVGSHPGSIASAFIAMGKSNGILFLDEFDRVSNGENASNIANTLLNITDFTQNHEYTDVYFGNDMKINLSAVWFIYSMNRLPDDGALRDRLFVIEVEGYSFSEKLIILQEFVLPAQLRNLGLKPGDITISDNTARFLLTRVSKTSEKGVRSLDKAVGDIVKKIDFLVSNQENARAMNISFAGENALAYPVELTDIMITAMLPQRKHENWENMFM